MHVRTDRLILEPLMAAHAPVLFPGFSDPALYAWIPQDPPSSADILAQRYSRLETRHSPDGSEQWLNWAVRKADSSEGMYVGLVEATVRSDKSASIAYFVFSEYWGWGYGQEAVGAVLDFLFAETKVAKVVAYIDTRNARSIRLVENLGFRRIAFVKDADRFKGSSSDEFVYERIADDH